MDRLPTLPRPVTYAIERHKIRILMVYGITCVLMLMPAAGLPGHAHAADSNGTVFEPPVYPIINKLPPPRASTAGMIITSETSIWPMHGKITTEFGANDEPFQASHTGIDISSTKPAGVIPVAAFRAGTVVQVIHSSISYGNHVVIDHGGGLTSLYGHLHDTTVTVGQHVNAGDILGHEGSTGASTGPHVHFETDLNGVPVSPRQFLAGNP